MSECTYRSGLEKAWAKELEKQNIQFEYENARIEVVTGDTKTIYVPDFYFPQMNIYGEVKGIHKYEGRGMAKTRALADSGEKVIKFMPGGKFCFISKQYKPCYLYTCTGCGARYFDSDDAPACPSCRKAADNYTAKENGEYGLTSWDYFNIPCLISRDQLLRESTADTDELETIAERLSGTPYYELITEDKIHQFKELSKAHPNMKEVEEYFTQIFSLLKFKKDARVSFPPILFVGNPGCGKTDYATKLSNIFCGKVIKLEFSNDVTGFQLTGSARGFSHAEPGMIVKGMYSTGKGPLMNPIFIFDEMEKIKSNSHSPENALLALLEKSSSKHFIDNYLEQSIDCSGINYIACCNSLHGIPAPVLNRFKVFRIPDYSRTQLVQTVIPALYKNWIQDENILPDRVPKELDKTFCIAIADYAKNSVRDIKHALLRLFNETQTKIYGLDVALFTRDQLSEYETYAGELDETDEMVEYREEEGDISEILMPFFDPFAFLEENGSKEGE